MVDIESDNSEDDGEQRDDGSGESDADDGQNEGGVQMKTLRMKMWQGIQAKTMSGIMRKCHWHATHLASMDGNLEDLGPSATSATHQHRQKGWHCRARWKEVCSN